MFDHYIGLDWAQKNMAIARMSHHSDKISTIDIPTNLDNFKTYLEQLRGTKILTFEETNTSQWLYTELVDLVDRVIICDPYRNRLLSEGPKNDGIDAGKLVQLLKANLVKEVYHSGEEFLKLRKLVSGYEDLVGRGVKLKNQRYAIFASQGKQKNKQAIEGKIEEFVLEEIDESIQLYEKNKERYLKEFERYAKLHPEIEYLISVPGIGLINAIKIVAQVVEPSRFKTKGHFLSYCGLVQHDKISGGRSYGKRQPRFCRRLKSVFKSAAFTVTLSRNTSSLHDYYQELLSKKDMAIFQAKHSVARRIATLCLGVLKSKKVYNFNGRSVCDIAKSF